MKTTLELPDELMRAARVRAANEGRRLKDVVAELIRRGLDAGPEGGGAVHHRVRLPLVRCAHAAAAGEEVTAERVAAILADEDETAAHPSP